MHLTPDNPPLRYRVRTLLSDDKVKLSGGVIIAAIILVLAFWGPAPANPRPMFGAADESVQEPTESTKPASTPEVKKDVTSKRPERSSGVKKAAPPAKRVAAPEQPSAKQAPVSKSKPAKPKGKPAAPKSKPAKPAPTRRPRKPAPVRAPGLTSARVRALPPGASIKSVRAALGKPVSAPKDLRSQEPAGQICRYWDLAAGEPAPMVRLCFNANGHLLARDFVAPAA